MQARWSLRAILALTVLATAFSLLRSSSRWTTLRAANPMAVPAASFEIVCEGLTGPERLNALMAGGRAEPRAAIGCDKARSR